nr:uncharacterized protein LOC113808573 [Penaeus vannamei]
MRNIGESLNSQFKRHKNGLEFVGVGLVRKWLPGALQDLRCRCACWWSSRPQTTALGNPWCGTTPGQSAVKPTALWLSLTIMTSFSCCPSSSMRNIQRKQREGGLYLVGAQNVNSKWIWSNSADVELQSNLWVPSHPQPQNEISMLVPIDKTHGRRYIISNAPNTFAPGYICERF